MRYDLSTHERDLNLIGIAVTQLSGLLNVFFTFSPLYMLTLIVGLPLPVRQAQEDDRAYFGRYMNFLMMFTNQIGLQEQLNFSKAEERILREEITQDPFTKGFALQRGPINNDLLTSDRKGFSRLATQTRERTFESTSLCALIWVSSTVISHSQEARNYINSLVGTNFKIPRLLVEKLQSIRQSTCGSLFITPIITPIFGLLLDGLDLRRTVWDFEWLVSKAGIDTYLSFISRLANYPANYIEMTELKETILFNSGFTTTATSWSLETVPSRTPIVTTPVKFFQVSTDASGQRIETEATYDATVITSEQKVLKLVPNNSYLNKPNMAHGVDSFIWGSNLYNTNLPSDDNKITMSSFSNGIYIDTSTQNFALYIVQRCTIFRNDVRKSNSKFSDKPKTNFQNRTDYKPVSKQYKDKDNTSITPQNGDLIQKISLLTKEDLKPFFDLINSLIDDKLYHLLINKSGRSKHSKTFNNLNVLEAMA